MATPPPAAPPPGAVLPFGGARLWIPVALGLGLVGTGYLLLRRNARAG
ncbi:MAG: hypothetical protein QN122_05010 [Armatimonadota bacterium]|nr:hypothetical protein [Armatimonadota bacterium]MDR7448803.1 hypothetical protein [Armatimonadota bacterium]MDR7460515.1 hypothetical protein [Armatimonadota bacterium]MDR7479625.1 hypothetical protein [Armatimonadota bacterium]MDR7490794.1 hypothetical protein [Armatimonadota bacterium]